MVLYSLSALGVQANMLHTQVVAACAAALQQDALEGDVGLCFNVSLSG